MADPAVSQSCSAHPSCDPGCPAARSRHGDPKTRSPPCDAPNKHTSAMPPSPHRCRAGHSTKPGKQSPDMYDPRGPQHEVMQLQGDLLDREQVATKAPQMSFKRRSVFSGRSSVNTMPGHLWAALVFSKGHLSSAPAFAEPLQASTAELGPP